MMKLIVGLGNPGEKYEGNRHNVGFMFVEYMINKLNEVDSVNLFNFEKKFNSDIIQITMKQWSNETIIFAKPQTFMNRSGEAVSKIKEFYKIPIEDSIIVHDDLDLRLGEWKIQKARGPKIHNGILSIEEKLGTKEFTRIRVGVDNREPENRMNGEAYVLSDFSEDEMQIVTTVFIEIADKLQNSKLKFQ